VGTYSGVASLLDEHDAKLADVQLTLATTDSSGAVWFGSVRNDDTVIDLNGHDVVIQLPTGTRGHATVQIVLTDGEAPRIRLFGCGPAPV
jgi:hypothetical protein